MQNNNTRLNNGNVVNKRVNKGVNNNTRLNKNVNKSVNNIPTKLMNNKNTENLLTKRKKYDLQRMVAILSNKIFRMLTIPELAILKKHSQKFIRDSVNYRIYEILSNQEDIESLMKSKSEFLSYLQNLDNKGNVNWNLLNLSNRIKNYNNQNQIWDAITNSVPDDMIPNNQKLMNINGSEIPLMREFWSMNNDLLRNNNCYAFSVMKISISRSQKSQPGNWSRTLGGNGDNVLNNMNARARGTCEDLIKRALKDLPGSYILNYNQETQECELPKRGFYRIFLMIAKNSGGNILDFHWARQTSSGLFVHKRGHSTTPLAVDARGKLILNPYLANWDYGELNYNKPCAMIACPAKHY